MPSGVRTPYDGNRIVSHPQSMTEPKTSPAKPRPSSTVLPKPPANIPGGKSNAPAVMSPQIPRVDGQAYDPFGDARESPEAPHAATSHAPPPLPSRSRPSLLSKIQSADLLTHSPESIPNTEVTSPDEISTPLTASRSIPLPPPRPPPRHRSTLSPDVTVQANPVGAPPPLPVRRGAHSPETISATVGRVEAKSGPAAPEASAAPLTVIPSSNQPISRRVTVPNPDGGPDAVALSAAGPNVVKNAQLPPPPKRMIGLGEKLPPVRPSAAEAPADDDDSSGEESGEDLDPKNQLPDESRASRRPPILRLHQYSASRISVTAHTGMVAVSANRVVMASSHHVKIYDLSHGDTPQFDIDLKDALDWKNKDTKISSIAFRWSGPGRAGCFLWCGLSGGHMVEINVRTGQVSGMKAAAHSGSVTHLFRHGRGMISLDETGKVLIWNPSPEEFGEELIMAFTQPRVVRIAEKQGWAKIIDGRLWTSARADNAGHHNPIHHNAGGGSRGPNIRIYDIFTPGSTGKTVLPAEHAGPVTSGTLLPSHPNRAYLGHEGGYISVWELRTEDGYPRCEEVVKVSVSDVLSLQGINERLWMGGRKGMITAYEVGPRPWIVRNCWRAHEDLPVLRIEVDPWSLEGLGKLAVFSVGRDEQVKYWDGLLSGDWVGECKHVARVEPR
jgi:hypothetical protein